MRSSTDDAPRYSDAAGVENHPQVTDFVPRRYRTIVTLVRGRPRLQRAVLATLDYFASTIGQAVLRTKRCRAGSDRPGKPGILDIGGRAAVRELQHAC